METSRSAVATLRRGHSLVRDLVFPFHEPRQFLTLAGMACAIFLIASRFSTDPLGYTLVGWLGGQAVLTTVAPAVLTLPIRRREQLERCLTAMRFVPVDRPGRWTFDRPAWTKWNNSDVRVEPSGDRIIVSGPLSTLAFLRRRLGDRA